MRHLFPITPPVNERLLHLIAWTLFTGSAFEFNISDGSPASVGDVNIGGAVPIQHLAGMNEVAAMSSGLLSAERALTFLTALAATVASLVPAKMLPTGLRDSAECLLTASRKTLQCYHDLDVDRPCATSIVIRSLHSLCTHAAGQPRLSWYILGEAIHVAQGMRIYDEASFAGLLPSEVRLRRSIFCQLSTGDKSSAILNGQPFAFSSTNFDKPFTVQPLSLDQSCLLDFEQRSDSARLASYVNTGFNPIASIFDRATRVLLTLRSLRDGLNGICDATGFLEAHQASVANSSSAFHVVIDDLPDWVQRPWQACSQKSGLQDYTGTLQSYVWILHTNIMLTYHCLRLILLTKGIEFGCVDMLGYNNNPKLLALHKLNVAHDAIQILRSTPFDALQMNSESSVSNMLVHKFVVVTR